MKTRILSNLNNPGQLERLYRENKVAFRQEFNALYPELTGSPVADFWHERLNYDTEEAPWVSRSELLFVVIAALVAGTLAKLPQLLSIDPEFFYTRNVSFLVFPFLAAYFVRKNGVSTTKVAVLVGVCILSALFINFLPDNPQSDTLVLSCIHLGLFLWALTGFAFAGTGSEGLKKRLGYLRYNGDLIVMSTLLLISGFIMTAITIGLFSLIGLSIEEFYIQYIVIFGLPAVPLIGTVLIQAIPQLVQKVSPVIARLFSPLVLITLLVYLGAIIFSGKDPYNDREFLMLFNALLVGVMALIFFSVAERAKTPGNRYEIMIIFLLSAVTILVNGIALSAIVFRIAEWGITPNRLAVLGANVLMLINLLLVTGKLVKVLTRDADLTEVGKSISVYLPVYWIWAAIVTFLFPLLFGFQ